MNAKNLHGCRAERGFSLVEALIGAGLLLLVVLGILPLFTRAMMDNAAGADYSRVTAFAKSKAEEYSAIPWSNATYSVQGGQTSLVYNEYLNPTTNLWVATPTAGPPANAQWTRTYTMRNYLLPDTVTTTPPVQYTVQQPGGKTVNVGAYRFDAASALDGAATAQVKEIEVRVQNIAPTGPLGARRQTVFRLMKAF